MRQATKTMTAYNSAPSNLGLGDLGCTAHHPELSTSEVITHSLQSFSQLLVLGVQIQTHRECLHEQISIKGIYKDPEI